MKNTFVVSCPIDTYSGYGARSRDFVKALIESNKYDVQILAQRWGKCSEGFIKDNKEWKFLSKHIIPNLTTHPASNVQHSDKQNLQEYYLPRCINLYL